MKKIEKIKNDYIKNLKKFIEKYKLETDFLEDIEERIAEKLEKIENPTENDIRNILKEIWSPEEIFKEELGEKLEEEPKNLWQKFLKKSDKVIFLWVFYELWKKTKISANIFRILFLFLIFVGFLGNGVLIPILFFTYFIGFLLLRTWIFRFFFSWIFGLICVAILIPAILIFGAYISNFHIENIYPFMEISSLLPIWLGIWIFSMIILATFFFYYAFFGKTFWVSFFLTWIISFIVAIIIWIWVFWDLFSKYYWIQREEKSFEFNVENVDLSNSFMNYNYFHDDIFSSFRIVDVFFRYWEIGFSDDNKIYLTIEKSSVWNFAFLEKYKNFIKDYKIELKDSFFNFKIDFDRSKNYPLLPTTFSIKSIKIPKNKIFYANYWQLTQKDIIFPNKEENEKFSGTVFKLCEKYFFDDEWKLNCEAKEAERILKQTKENYIPNEYEE